MFIEQCISMDKSTDILWDKAIIGLAELNNNGNFIRANPAFCNLLGYSETELKEKHWEEVTHPTDADGSRDMMARCVKGAIPGFTMESRYLTKRGNVTWVYLHISSVLDKNGLVKYLLKQVLNDPIIIPAVVSEPEKKEGVRVRDKYKLIIAAVIGCIFTIFGAYLHNVEIQSMGMALVVGLFGGYLAKK